MKIIKFGGKSLANGSGISNAVDILIEKLKKREKLVVACSARGNATNELEGMLEKASQGLDFKTNLEAFKESQKVPLKSIDFEKEFEVLETVLEGVKLVRDYSPKTKDLVLAQGELLSIKMISSLLNQKGANTFPLDSRDLLVTDESYGEAKILDQQSLAKITDFFKTIPVNNIPIISGFIAATEKGDTTTLGRNGSNYSASLLAKYLSASEIESFTHVDGIYSSNPDQVNDAQIIQRLNYREANELASFGASILHSKTISPLIDKEITLKILNTFNKETNGTVIDNKPTEKSVKSITTQSDIAVIVIEGKGLLGKSGIDARIFNALQRKDISIGLISQGSSERGVSFVVKKAFSDTTIQCLINEFKAELKEKDIDRIYAKESVVVITVIGQSLNGFGKAYQSLVSNGIEILLINNTLSGRNISLVVNNKDESKAVNLIHSQIFGVNKKINIAVFGKGTVGASFINQIIESRHKILNRKETKLNVFAIAGQQKVLLAKEGITNKWREDFEKEGISSYKIQDVINYAEKYHLENLILVDNTASTEFVKNYNQFIEHGFDIISSNKVANTIDFKFYKNLRQTLRINKKEYLYETNVGAGLPLIDTIRLLHDSGENITRIKGVFSGSLSYIFNQFSGEDQSFSEVLKNAINLGLTEPDPREDLSGNDVARKLLVLARELDLENEFEDINIQNLIPESLKSFDKDAFLNQLSALDQLFETKRNQLNQGEVLRYVGDLHGDLRKTKGKLDVRLVKVSEFSALGQLSGSDSLFEIYTESYGERPIIIQGAGAGAEVTARGVFGDLLRIAEKK